MYSVPRQDYTVENSSNRCFECDSSHCRIESDVFGDCVPDFLEDNWQTNGCVPFNLTVLRCSSGTIATCPVFPKKTGDHLLKSASCTSNFCWIWLILKHPYNRLLFTSGLIRLNSQFITRHDIIDMFRSTAIVFLEHFFRLIDTSLFLSD